MKSTIKITAFLSFLFTIGITYANTIFVNTHSNGSGTSWEDATSDLTAALNLAEAGDEVWVAKGVYKAHSTDRQVSFKVKKGVKLLGGFAGTENSPAQRISNNRSVLCGEIGQPGLIDNSFTVLYIGAADENTVVDGFVVQNGNANGDAAETMMIRCGGGLYVDGKAVSAKPILKNCIFKNNNGRDGAGVFNNGRGGEASPVFVNCKFSYNVADLDGGAIYNDGKENGNSNPSFKNCIFSSNEGTYGGAIFNATQTGTCNLYLENCDFNDNNAYLRGGAVFNMDGKDKCNIEMLDCSFSGNFPDNQSKLFTDNSARSGVYNLLKYQD